MNTKLFNLKYIKEIRDWSAVCGVLFSISHKIWDSYITESMTFASGIVYSACIIIAIPISYYETKSMKQALKKNIFEICVLSYALIALCIIYYL